MELKKNETLYLSELNSVYSLEEILNLMQAQLIKDFEKCGLNLVSIPLQNSKQLNSLLENELKRINVSTFEQLSYVVDLPENLNCVELFQQNEFNMLSELISFRALTKVYFRYKYSNT